MLCYRVCLVSVMWVRVNGCLSIFGTNQKQRRLLHKELRIHDDAFATVRLPNNWPTKATRSGWQILDQSSFVNSSRHMYPLGTNFYCMLPVSTFPPRSPFFPDKPAGPWFPCNSQGQLYKLHNHKDQLINPPDTPPKNTLTIQTQHHHLLTLVHRLSLAFIRRGVSHLSFMSADQFIYSPLLFSILSQFMHWGEYQNWSVLEC